MENTKPRLTTAFLLMISVLFVSFGCAGVTSSGMNRSVLCKEMQGVSLPYKVLIDEKSPNIECKTEVYRGPIPTSFLFLMGGLGGIVGGKAMEKAMEKSGIMPDPSRAHGTFLAGQAFAEVVKRISTSSDKADPVLQLTLLKFQPVFTMEAMNVNRRLAANIEFLAAFQNNGDITRSAYACEYKVGNNDFFTSQKEKDLLREMTDISIMHWAKKLLQTTTTSTESAHFPEHEQGQLVIEGGQCSYLIFAPYNATDQRDTSGQTATAPPNDAGQGPEERVK